ncbi:hypothetical protein WJX84_008592 [Apatococcus fuscideae]|uniref:Uncharacterized protein n=1 Tax=Apatococcus fuscideae TaxID=2026836 RepID=A0AAW1TCN7_9CHLO
MFGEPSCFADWSFVAAAAYLAVWTLAALILGPKQGWHTSNFVFAPLAALYAVLLVASWDPSTLSLILPGSLKEGFSGGLKPQFLPKISGVQELFSRHITAASLMVHLSCINLFAARSILLKGGHSAWGKLCTVLCVILGPLGLLAGLLSIPPQSENGRSVAQMPTSA